MNCQKVDRLRFVGPTSEDALRGTDPESYITECTLVYEDYLNYTNSMTVY